MSDMSAFPFRLSIDAGGKVGRQPLVRNDLRGNGDGQGLNTRTPAVITGAASRTAKKGLGDEDWPGGQEDPDNYESDNPGSKSNLARILMHGRLGGSGKVVILPVDQGFEHGPDRSFAPNPDAYDPHYHYQLAVDAGLNAYAAPLGPLEAGADSFAGAIPTILKLNWANSLSTNKDQAVTGSVKDALRIGCAAIGFTIYPGSEDQYEMFEEIRALAEEAKSYGLAVVMWSYPRGGKLDKAGETAMDVCAYAAHMAALLGAHIIKVKPPRTGRGSPRPRPRSRRPTSTSRRSRRV